MAVEVWIGEEYEHTHEAEAIATFIGKMHEHFDAVEEAYHVLCNFLINGSPIDAAVLKRDAFIVVEMKDAGGGVSGGENGPWYVNGDNGRHELRGGKHGNPYLQARSYRFACIDLLNERSNDFLNNRPERVPFHKTVSATVAFSPTQHPTTNIKVGQKNIWFSHCGIDQLHEKVAQRTTQGVNFTSQEMKRLITRVLRLEAARMVGNTPLRPQAEVPPPPDPQPVAEPPPAPEPVAVEPELVGPEPEPLEPERIVVSPAMTATAEPPRCLICSMGAGPCDQPGVQGRVTALDDSSSPPALIVEVERPDGTRGTNRLALYQGTDVPTQEQCRSNVEFVRSRLLAKVPTSISALHVQRTNNGLAMTGESILLLEPDWLINVTDLTEVEYCPRKLLVKRYATDVPGEPAILGNAVHQAFREIWRGAEPEEVKAAITRSLNSQALGLVVTSTVPQDVVDAAEPHVRRLSDFAASQGRQSVFRSETFVLSPLLGMKGRIDAVWEQNGRAVIVGELKTGKSNNGAAREEHVLQVSAYSFMLVARGEAAVGQLKAILLYSGDPRQLLHVVELSSWRFRKVMAARNLLVRMDVTSNAPFADNINKCFPCSAKLACRHVGLLSGHRDKRAENHVAAMLPAGDPPVSKRDRQLFAHFARLTAAEFAAAKATHAQLWALSPEERAKSGKSLALDAESPPSGQKDPADGSFTYLLMIRPGIRNTSELRPGDSVILSGVDGPRSGRSTIATVTEALPDGLEVRMQEELLFAPAWADTYTDESLSERMFSGLYRFISRRSNLSELMFGPSKTPAYLRKATAAGMPSWREGLNERQALSVERSLQALQFLLVNGPPGSGKTTLIARMVQAHLAEGARVLIVSSTNRALDQALSKLSKIMDDETWLRLGSILSTTNEKLRKNTISELVRTKGLGEAQRALQDRRVMGSTISTLLSGSYAEAIGEFDLVIVDEATQSTIPATLGAISFAKRFVLIGDPKQLPPVCQSSKAKSDATADEAGVDALPSLEVSLFEYLAARYKGLPESVRVDLVEQYRMNDVLCSIPSSMWYEPELTLKPADVPSAAGVLIGEARLNCDDRWQERPSARFLDPQRPFLFIDVDMHPEGERTNDYEADLVARILLDMNASTPGLATPFAKSGEDAKGKVSVAVISPYRAQVARIRTLMAERDPEHIGMWNELVDTVDRFQGSEADAVLISLSPYTEKVADHIANARRLNVAMTRARHKLIILGCRSHLAGSELFQKLFTICDAKCGENKWYERHYTTVIP